MSKAWVMKPVAMPGLTVTSTAAGYDAANMVNDHAGIVWQSAGGADLAAILIDLGEPRVIDAALFFGCTGAQPWWTLAVSSADDAALTVNYTLHANGIPFLAGATLPTHGRGVGYWEANEEITARRYWRFAVSGLSGEQLVVARLALGERIQLARNFSFGGGWGVRDLGRVEFSGQGVRVRQRSVKMRTLGLTFPAVTKEEAETKVQPLIEAIGGQEPIVLVTDPEAHSERQRRCWFGHLFGELGMVWRTASAWEWRANLIDLFSIPSVVVAPAPLFSPAALPGFGWSESYRFTVSKAGSTYSTSLDPTTLVDEAVWTGPAYYVKSAGGSDVANGLTLGAALATMTKAIQLGQAGGVPFRIFPQAGTYRRAQGVFDLGATPTPDFAVIPQGGRVTFGAHDVLIYTNDGSATNTYTSARSSVGRVFDLLNFDANGYYVELAQRADADVAGVRANPGSWCQNGANVVVHRADGAAVTSTNTRAYVRIENIGCGTVSTNIYMENADIEGGFGFRVLGGTRAVALVNSTVRYTGGAAAIFDGVRIVDVDGLVMLQGVDSSANAKDCFNASASAPTATTYVLTVNCTGKDSGRFGATSVNAITAHSPFHRWIDIGGNYSDPNDGDIVAMVGGSKAWCLGTETAGAPGPNRGGFLSQDAEVWLENTLSSDSVSIQANVNGVVHKRHHTSAGSEVTATGGTITAF